MEYVIASLVGAAIAALGLFVWNRRSAAKAHVMRLLAEAEALDDELTRNRARIEAGDGEAIIKRRKLIEQIEDHKEDIRAISKKHKVKSGEIDARMRRLGLR